MLHENERAGHSRKRSSRIAVPTPSSRSRLAPSVSKLWPLVSLRRGASWLTSPGLPGGTAGLDGLLRCTQAGRPPAGVQGSGEDSAFLHTDVSWNIDPDDVLRMVTVIADRRDGYLGESLRLSIEAEGFNHVRDGQVRKAPWDDGSFSRDAAYEIIHASARLKRRQTACGSDSSDNSLSVGTRTS